MRGRFRPNWETLLWNKNIFKVKYLLAGDGIGRAEEGAREDERGIGEGPPDVGQRGNHDRHVHLRKVQGKEVHL